MQKIKSFLIVILSFFVLLTLVSLLMPSRVITAHTVMINAPQEKISYYLMDLKNWKAWNPLLENAELNISEPSTAPNAYIMWKAGGKQNQIRLMRKDFSSLMFSQTRDGDNPVTNELKIQSFKDANELQVEWIGIHQLKWYPWEKFAGIFLDKITGPAYDTALNRLKVLAENN